jgi:DNA-binding SARP family transcriptional activator
MAPKYSAQQIRTAVDALKSYKEKPFVSHEWEELVSYLCRDNDPRQRERMYREMDEILEKDPGFKAFMMLTI